MVRGLAWGVLAIAIGCGTRANPAATCSDGQCSDPAFPFCDVDGSVGGTPGTCIAVDCMPGSVAECRGSAALTCNATGDNFDPVACDFGCDPAAGCLACQPGETVCANGAVVSCDGAGSETMTTCPLGCFADQPRCTDIDPSNGLAMYLDMVADPPDLHITASAQLNATRGELSMNGSDVTVPTFLSPPVSDDLGIRVVVVHDLTIDDSLSFAGGGSDGHGPALAIVATGAITINAPISGYGASLVSCAGGQGFDAADVPNHSVASGGGGNATNGGASGAIINDSAPGAAGGGVHGTTSLVPLIGGCDAGLVTTDSGNTYVGAFGGGALQLSSRVAITVSARIDVSGSSGYTQQIQTGEQSADEISTGGGGGGGLLLEAPVVSLTSAADLEAGGGDGAALCSTPSAFCSLGGAGAKTSGMPGRTAGNVTDTSQTNNYFTGGGGGGLGRVRINTPLGQIDLTENPVIVGDVSAGMLQTR